MVPPSKLLVTAVVRWLLCRRTCWPSFCFYTYDLWWHPHRSSSIWYDINQLIFWPPRKILVISQLEFRSRKYILETQNSICWVNISDIKKHCCGEIGDYAAYEEIDLLTKSLASKMIASVTKTATEGRLTQYRWIDPVFPECWSAGISRVLYIFVHCTSCWRIYRHHMGATR